MKSTDIIAGESYKVGYYGRGQVLETLVPRRNRKDGVKVLLEAGHFAGQEMLVSSRDVTCLWSEHKAEQETLELSRKIAQRDRKRVSDKVELIGKAFAEAGIELRDSNTHQDWGGEADGYFASLQLEEGAIDQLLAALGAMTAETQGAEAQATASDDLADLLS